MNVLENFHYSNTRYWHEWTLYDWGIALWNVMPMLGITLQMLNRAFYFIFEYYSRRSENAEVAPFP